jgi:hypothetical protein
LRTGIGATIIIVGGALTNSSLRMSGELRQTHTRRQDMRIEDLEELLSHYPPETEVMVDCERCGTEDISGVVLVEGNVLLIEF